MLKCTSNIVVFWVVFSSRRSVLIRAAFAMALLATKKDDTNLAEALHLEAVLVLDRLPEVRFAVIVYFSQS